MRVHLSDQIRSTYLIDKGVRSAYIKGIEHLCLVDLVAPFRYNERRGGGGGEGSGCCPTVFYHSWPKNKLKFAKRKGHMPKLCPKKLVTTQKKSGMVIGSWVQKVGMVRKPQEGGDHGM